MKRLIVSCTVLVIVGILTVFVALASGTNKANQDAATSKREGHGSPVSTNRPDLGPDQSEVIVYGSVSLKLFIDLQDTDLKSIEKEHPEFFNKIGPLGWQHEGGRFFRVIPAKDVTIHFNNQTIDVRDGKYAFVTDESSGSEQRQELKRYFGERMQKKIGATFDQSMPLSLTIKGVPIPTGNLEISKVDTGLTDTEAVHLDIMENIDFRELKAHMHGGAHGQVQGEKGAGPMERCMDYNGPMTDGGNYPVTSYRAFVNFVCSDCDLAGGGRCSNCWGDHFVGGCQINHGRICSYSIGHSPNYHKHSWADCRYCL